MSDGEVAVDDHRGRCGGYGASCCRGVVGAPVPNAVALVTVWVSPEWMVSVQSLVKSQSAVPHVPVLAVQEERVLTDGCSLVVGAVLADGSAVTCEAERTDED
ncbi:hypothetical protein OZX57_08470 [Bifidobacterium sp. ESL0682]|uniref:hypothetical protein n=1 Tax=Bifidobacterium sp. ESL0682 TaxID=2983212 RepID=UPI0023F673EA|nr:hypothetical protein [Bifidobacterium sp. ESL0682]WEV41953.1 hypothetical protein OZX57_08470 [Bifidobacterium sp. ESL0682]